MRRAFAHPYLLVVLVGLVCPTVAVGALTAGGGAWARSLHECPLGPEGGHAPALKLIDAA